MSRIPIYKTLVNGFELRSNGISVAVEKTVFELYLEKFFISFSSIENLREGLKREAEMISKKAALSPDFSYDDSFYLPEGEEFNIKDARENIAEFYLRLSFFLSLMKGSFQISFPKALSF